MGTVTKRRPLIDVKLQSFNSSSTELLWSTLQLVNAHMQALLHLPSPTNTLKSLQQFHDSVESHIRSLSSLVKESGSHGDLLITIIMDELPVDTIKT